MFARSRGALALAVSVVAVVVVCFGVVEKAEAALGDKIGEIGGDLARHQGVGVDELTGNIYVADTNNGRVVIFDPAGKQIGEFEVDAPSAEGEEWVEGVNVDEELERIYVANGRGSSVAVHDMKTYEYLFNFGGVGWCTRTCINGEYVWVVGMGEGTFLQYRRSKGLQYEQANGYSPQGLRPDGFDEELCYCGQEGYLDCWREPYGIAFDNYGYMAFSCTHFARVPVFDPDLDFVRMHQVDG